MDINIPQRWTEQARYDLVTARAMLESERFLYVPFCCQQAVEKSIKALVAKVTSQMPPRSHNLMHLAKRAGLDPNPRQSLLMRELSEYYVQSRYPDESETVSATLGKVAAQDILERTEVFVQWLSSMI